MNARPIIVVEGKYDTMAVKRACPEAVVIETRGFGIFKDRTLGAFIKKAAEQNGIIVLTDSDGAGLLIRKRLSAFIDKKQIKNAYIPMIEGKERRKKKPSAEGTLGVEGMPPEIIRQALEKCGLFSREKKEPEGRQITKGDLYADGLCGGENAAKKRQVLAEKTGLPQNLSANRLLEALNLFLSYADYRNLMDGKNPGKETPQ